MYINVYTDNLERTRSPYHPLSIRACHRAEACMGEGFGVGSRVQGFICRVYVDAYMYIRMYICINTYIYIYIYIHIYPLSAETFEPFARFNENYYTNV